MDSRIVTHENQSDPKWHLPLAALQHGLQRLPAAPKETGRVTLIVRKTAEWHRLPLERARFTPEHGLEEDQWNRGSRMPDAQLAVMRHDVAELIANGQPLTVFGDNLFVTLDISAANLPAGTRLRIGEMTVEVTPMPHDGCKKFNGRFGNDAFKFVQAPATRALNLRGIYWKVVEPGEAWVGAEVRVLARPVLSYDPAASLASAATGPR